MKTAFIVFGILASSLTIPVNIDYVPSDIINLNNVVSWETDKEDDTLVLTLYTDDGNFYVIEK